MKSFWATFIDIWQFFSGHADGDIFDRPKQLITSENWFLIENRHRSKIDTHEMLFKSELNSNAIGCGCLFLDQPKTFLAWVAVSQFKVL